MSWKKWAVVVGGIISIVGQFWGNSYYLPVIGGVIAVIAGILIED